MSYGSARLAYAAHVAGVGRDFKAETRGKDHARVSSHKGDKNKKSPSLLKALGRKVLGSSSRDELARNDPISSPVITTTTQQAVDLLAALDPHEEADTNEDSEASSLNSDSTLVASIDYTPYTQGQEQRTQGGLGSVQTATEAEYHDDTDSLASTLAEEDQQHRKWRDQSCDGLQTMLMLLGAT